MNKQTIENNNEKHCEQKLQRPNWRTNQLLTNNEICKKKTFNSFLEQIFQNQKLSIEHFNSANLQSSRFAQLSNIRAIQRDRLENCPLKITKRSGRQ